MGLIPDTFDTSSVHINSLVWCGGGFLGSFLLFVALLQSAGCILCWETTGKLQEQPPDICVFLLALSPDR